MEVIEKLKSFFFSKWMPLLWVVVFGTVLPILYSNWKLVPNAMTSLVLLSCVGGIILGIFRFMSLREEGEEE